MDLQRYPSLQNVVQELLHLWPDHADYAEKSFSGRSDEIMDVSEQIASCVLKLSAESHGGLAALCSDYQFLCEQIVLPEEIFFRRHNRYRLSSFEDANRECYANRDFMGRYMNGLLISNILWNNHAHAIAYYVRSYLPSLSTGSHLLEVGPGHGLFLYFANLRAEIVELTGWDVSPTSIESTRSMLERLGATRKIDLALKNLFEASPPDQQHLFDGIVMSELLEHLEDPVAALRAAARLLKPNGAIWINVPANSPAPDHIFLVRSPEHASEIVRSAGLDVADARAYPMTGSSLEKAIKRQLAISCVITARRPASPLPV
jgi:2-polyprenyl-3-methyl-5-hydroxy-6-metoxy-1,4-benzoquinol methylase